MNKSNQTKSNQSPRHPHPRVSFLNNNNGNINLTPPESHCALASPPRLTTLPTFPPPPSSPPSPFTALLHSSLPPFPRLNFPSFDTRPFLHGGNFLDAGRCDFFGAGWFDGLLLAGFCCRRFRAGRASGGVVVGAGFDHFGGGLVVVWVVGGWMDGWMEFKRVWFGVKIDGFRSLVGG